MQTQLIHPDLLQDFSKILELLTYMAEASLVALMLLCSSNVICYLFSAAKHWFKKK